MKRKPETISLWRRRLPHWEIVDGRYFVTIHLAGAIPLKAQAEIRLLSKQYQAMPTKSANERLRLHRRIFATMEAWLDRVSDVNFLTLPQIADMVSEAIAHRSSVDWQPYEYVIMPNHLHIFCELKRANLKLVIEDFKRWTGHRAVKLLEGQISRFWQDEWFDHWSRSDEEDERICEYIRQNPVKAGLVADYRDWVYGSWSAKSSE